jgi:uncharacterized caspase-like protein
MNLTVKKPLSLILGGILFVGCGGGSDLKTVDLSTIEGANVDQLYIVDCLLPGSVRQLGKRLTYLSARRVVKTSGSECGIRGGEFVAHDRANYQTALKIWMPLANNGDVKAQSYVGEIYEKGLGVQPNYQKAALWYQKAANQGYSRAKMSLGSLYERGLGVSRNSVKALSLYRDASGLKDRQLEFVSGAQRKARITQGKQLTHAQQQLQAAQKQVSQLQREVNGLQAQTKKLRNLPPQVVTNTLIKTQTVVVSDPQQAKVIAKLNREVQKLRTEAEKTQQEITLASNSAQTSHAIDTRALQAQNTRLRKQLKRQKSALARKQNEILTKQVKTRSVTNKTDQKRQIVALNKRLTKKEKQLKQQENKVATLRSVSKSTTSSSNSRNLNGINFGRYYAVVIGNNNYSNVANLTTAVNDAKSVASVLKNQYGFRTIVLSNASRARILAAFDSLRKRLTAKDNLVIYYAGHGELSRGRGFWLPADADKKDKKTWISNEQVTNFIDAMKAKHVLVVADSCYSGTLSRSSIPRPILNSSKDRAWFDAVANTKVRIVMSSGGVKPVLDSGGGNHSIFASAFLDVLRSGNTVLEGTGLFQAIRNKISKRGQTPVYAPIRFAGHEAGDFIFLQNGRVALLDSSPEKEDDEKTAYRLFALRETSIAST